MVFMAVIFKSVFITYTHEAHVKHKSFDVNVTHSNNECIVILGPIHNLFIENVSIVAIKIFSIYPKSSSFYPSFPVFPLNKLRLSLFRDR